MKQMDLFRKIAENRIREAMERGEFDKLSNSGKPLNLDEDSCIPEDLRVAYKVLKNAGCLPPELELRNEIISLRELIDTLDDDKERLRKIRQLNFKLLKLNTMKKRPFSIDDLPEYEEKLLNRFIETGQPLGGREEKQAEAEAEVKKERIGHSA